MLKRGLQRRFLTTRAALPHIATRQPIPCAELLPAKLDSMAAVAAAVTQDMAGRVATATFVTGGALGNLAKSGAVYNLQQLLAVSMSQLLLTSGPQGSTAPTLATSGQKAAHFCSSQRKPQQRRARRRVAGLLAVTAAAAAARQVLTESVLSDCPSDPLLHNVRDRKTRMQLVQQPQQAAAGVDPNWVFSLALQSSML